VQADGDRPRAGEALGGRPKADGVQSACRPMECRARAGSMMQALQACMPGACRARAGMGRADMGRRRVMSGGCPGAARPPDTTEDAHVWGLSGAACRRSLRWSPRAWRRRIAAPTATTYPERRGVAASLTDCSNCRESPLRLSALTIRLCALTAVTRPSPPLTTSHPVSL
jgi:hypothetical protein